MNIFSWYKLLLILITLAIHFSEQIKHINQQRSIDACKGKDVDLIWKVEEEINKISKLEWYFNNKIICTSSPVEDFAVRPPYHGRIDRIGRTEIRLRNVSIDDEGTYILFPLLAWSTSQNMQNITLRVLEPPTNYCTCKMGHPLDSTFKLTSSYCGRPLVSHVWKRKQTFEVLGEGNHILNSTLQDKEVLCCQNGEAMKCVDDSRQFCTTVSIPHQDTERPSEDGNTQRTDLVIMSGTDTGSTNTHHMVPVVLATFIICLLTAILVILVFIIICKIRKKNKDEEKNVPMMQMCEAVIPLIKKDPGLETKEPISVHKPMNESETNIELQTVQPSTLYPRLEIISMHYEHQNNPSLETMKEIQELHRAALCKQCFVKEIRVVFIPCSHSVTCAHCSIPLKQCPVCGVLIKMKMNICSD
ncbi:hypothetical protein ACJMK2_026337 [Sinanodonta woodiana]|uniref:RING-type domain-containing protein n=1 Tax=Sinanodonta woodiana TaxID=1069815 RepID=A0ABD3XJB1_SINWO